MGQSIAASTQIASMETSFDGDDNVITANGKTDNDDEESDDVPLVSSNEDANTLQPLAEGEERKVTFLVDESTTTKGESVKIRELESQVAQLKAELEAIQRRRRGSSDDSGISFADA